MGAVLTLAADMSGSWQVTGSFARVVTLCPNSETRMCLSKILHRHGLEVHEAATWRDVTQGLRFGLPRAVICETTLPDADWRQVVGEMAFQKTAPRVIVLSRRLDLSLWAEVINLGGYDVLLEPLVEEEVRRVVDLACRNWMNEKEQRNKPVKVSLGKEIKK